MRTHAWQNIRRIGFGYVASVIYHVTQGDLSGSSSMLSSRYARNTFILHCCIERTIVAYYDRLQYSFPRQTVDFRDKSIVFWEIIDKSLMFKNDNDENILWAHDIIFVVQSKCSILRCEAFNVQSRKCVGCMVNRRQTGTVEVIVNYSWRDAWRIWEAEGHIYQ